MTMNLSGSDLSSTTAVPRRLGVYSNPEPPMRSLTEYRSTSKRKLKRRPASICGTLVVSDVHDTSDNTIQIANGESEQTKAGVRDKPEYSTPRAIDIIVGPTTNPDIPQEGHVVLKKYARAMYGDSYREAADGTGKLLIVYTLLNNVKDRRGKFLQESSSDLGMYIEVDDSYALEKIEEALTNKDFTS